MKKGSDGAALWNRFGADGCVRYAACELKPLLKEGLNAPGNGAKPLNGAFDSKFPSLFQSDDSFQPLFQPALLFQFELLFHAGALFQPLNDGAKPLFWFQPLNGVLFHAPGKLFQLFVGKLPSKLLKPLNGVLFQPLNDGAKPLGGVFQPEFQFWGPKLPPALPPKPDHGVEPEFQFHAPGKVLPAKLLLKPLKLFVGKLPPQLLFQLLFGFDGKPPLKPGKPAPGKFDANGVLNMVFPSLNQSVLCDHSDRGGCRVTLGGSAW